MHTFVIKKGKQKNVRQAIRYSGLGLVVLGLLLGMYIFFPLLSWEIYLKPVFANQNFASPIPKTTIITKAQIQSLLKNTARTFENKDYSNVQNWLPQTYKEVQITSQTAVYYLSVPKLKIENATVSTVDNDLSQHLVHFPGTAIPPAKGTAVIFGHSTLPQWFDPKNYKTIFATAHTLEVGDTFTIMVNNVVYNYKISDISIVEPEDISYLTQNYSDSYITIVTCTPPGTTWKRLIITARIEKI